MKKYVFKLVEKSGFQFSWGTEFRPKNFFHRLASSGLILEFNLQKAAVDRNLTAYLKTNLNLSYCN